MQVSDKSKHTIKLQWFTMFCKSESEFVSDILIQRVSLAGPGYGWSFSVPCRLVLILFLLATFPLGVATQALPGQELHRAVRSGPQRGSA